MTLFTFVYLCLPLFNWRIYAQILCLFSSSQPFLIEGVLASKNLFCESWQDRHLSRPCLPFWGPLAAILNFAGIAMRWASAPGATKLVLLQEKDFFLNYRVLYNLIKVLHNEVIYKDLNLTMFSSNKVLLSKGRYKAPAPAPVSGM